MPTPIKKTQKTTPATPAPDQIPATAAVPKRTAKEIRDRLERELERTHETIVELHAAEATEEELATYRLIRFVDFHADYEDHSSDITAEEFENLKKFLKIMRQDRGYITPVDEFITLLCRHADKALTPEKIQVALDECKQNFETAIPDARLLARQYPNLFAPEETVYVEAQ